ncbi:DUF1772 domain-containing protein [Allomuricauda sp. M10]|uniref:anthrone oxygenase family protein n=1 Tax=Allomuricauda sp. M10 TaxID=2683292 RepID=UPI001D1927CF|nr:DUF1772 domain-containing protein [Muricauda sp. M10]
MTFTLPTISTFVTLLLSGLTAGLCYTWTNAVTPGIGQLNDLGYLQSFQEMNRAIINPTFLIVFFGPFFAHIVNLYQNWGLGQQHPLFWLYLSSAALFIIGVTFVTLLGNIPLNEMLNKADLNHLSEADLSTLRNRFENPWNQLHWIRTLCSLGSFILLIIAQLQK